MELINVWYNSGESKGNFYSLITNFLVFKLVENALVKQEKNGSYYGTSDLREIVGFLDRLEVEVFNQIKSEHSEDKKIEKNKFNYIGISRRKRLYDYKDILACKDLFEYYYDNVKPKMIDLESKGFTTEIQEKIINLTFGPVNTDLKEVHMSSYHSQKCDQVEALYQYIQFNTKKNTFLYVHSDLFVYIGFEKEGADRDDPAERDTRIVLTNSAMFEAAKILRNPRNIVPIKTEEEVMVPSFLSEVDAEKINQLANGIEQLSEACKVQ